MKKNGFTLIELLAIIIILAIVVLIATPVVLNVISDAREKANINSAYGIINAADLYYGNSYTDTNKKPKIDGKTDVYSELDIDGGIPEIGFVYINRDGEVSVALKYGDNCYKKGFKEEKITSLKYDSNTCKAETSK